MQSEFEVTICNLFQLRQKKSGQTISLCIIWDGRGRPKQFLCLVVVLLFVLFLLVWVVPVVVLVLLGVVLVVVEVGASRYRY